MDDSPSGRGPLLVGLAVLLLAIIGGAVGLILGHNTVDTSAVGRGDQTTAATSGPGPTTTTPEPPPVTTSPPATSPTACPERMRRFTPYSLELVLYVRTEVPDGLPSEVWICKNGKGGLYYQGHRGRPGEPLTDNDSLFLDEVVYVEATGYKATNRTDKGTYTYLIAGDTLTITSPDGSTEQQHIVESHDAPG